MKRKKSTEISFSFPTTYGDIILKEELDEILGTNVHYILTREEKNFLYKKGPIDKDFLVREITDFTKPFYVCGPDKMVADINGLLTGLGANPDTIVFEK